MTYLIKWWDETSVIKSLMDENSQESHININLILIYPLNNGAKNFPLINYTANLRNT